jgi:ABC-2 type transport system permease protein
MKAMLTVFKREFAAYFATPLAYVFIFIFLVLSGSTTFFLGGFFERGQADLAPFFGFHPWLYLLLVPAVAMRLWADERKSGTVELLLTLPISIGQAVVGKFLAAWAFAGIALVLTFPMWITVNYLGSPDNGVILTSYIGSFVMAGSYLAIGSCFSALSKNQVIAFVLAAVVCLLFTVSGTPLVLNAFSSWAPATVVDTISNMSMLANFDGISRGVLDAVNIIYFGSVIALFLFANTVLVSIFKAR